MKIILLIIAVGLIGVVLYLGYCMDKDEENKKRKEKLAKNDNLYNTDIEDKVSNYYSPEEAKVKQKKLQSLKDKLEEKKDDFNDYIEEKRKEKYKKKVERLDRIESYKSDYAPIDDEFVENGDASWEFIDEESLIERREEVLEEKPLVSSKKDIDKTAVIEKSAKKEKKEMSEKTVEVPKVKGYEDIDSEEDDEYLLAIEQAIAEANIKKFTRSKTKKATSNKKTKAKSKAENSNVKRFTKKKEKAKEEKKEEKKKPAKKYTRKKVVKIKEEEKEEKKEPKKRGRKPKAK